MVDPFVTWNWCRERTDRVVFADVRWHLDEKGYAGYAAGHIPGAVFLDLDKDLAGQGAPTDGRHPLPTPEHFARALSAAGIDGTRPVITYDSEGGIFAARLTWMLRVIGVESAVLDGGLYDVDLELETGWPPRAAAVFNPRPWPAHAIRSTQQVLAATKDDSAILIDARPAARFHGKDSIDMRAGHIPGAVSVPCRDHLTTTGHLRGRTELARAFGEAGILPGSNANVISYCGSGVTGCHNALVMEHLGLGRPALYPGSFSAWAADERLPVKSEA